MNDLERSFDLLRLKPGATPEEVKRAFRVQVAAWHPDRFPADPAMQRQAEKRLRLVIEAHRTIVSSNGASGSGNTMAARVGPTEEKRDTPGSAGGFFCSVPNIVFSVAVFGCALLGAVRHGITIHAWIYGVEMALVPAIFSVAYNLTARNNTTVRNLYLGFSLCVLVVIVVQGVMNGAERYAPAGEREVFSGSAHDGGTTGGAWPFPRGGEMDRAGDGASPPPHGQIAPRAPAAPLAPVAPAAPQAPAAPAPPLAR